MVSREAKGSLRHDGITVLRFVLRSNCWNHSLCFFVFTVYAPENCVQCARIAARDGETWGLTPWQSTPTNREPGSWPSETGRIVARRSTGAGV